MANPLAGLDNLINKLGKESGSIRAFHGSPYDFDRFDASKIGTGEGAQSYGYGHYFGGRESTAKYYKDNVPGVPRYSSPRELAADYLFVHGTPEDAGRVLKDHMQWLAAGGNRPMYADALKLLRDGDQITPKEFPHIDSPGRMYEVEIDHPESALLDWDAQLDSQSPAIRKALARLGAVPEMPSGLPYGPSGEHAYRKLVNEISMYSQPARRGHLPFGKSSAMAAARLTDEGIPGIRYLDQGSRLAGEGTSNYVVFPGAEDSIRILRKFGLLAPVATGAASQYDAE